MADGEPRPGLRKLQAVWHLARLLLMAFFLVGGPILVVVGTFVAASQVAATPLGPDSRSADGVVVGHHRTQFYGSSRSTIQFVYAPIVRFNVDGRDLEITSRLATNAPPAIGERVRVRYHLSAPEHAVLVGWAEWGQPLEMLAMGAAMLAGGIVGRRRRWTERRDSWW